MRFHRGNAVYYKVEITFEVNLEEVSERSKTCKITLIFTLKVRKELPVYILKWYVNFVEVYKVMRYKKRSHGDIHKPTQFTTKTTCKLLKIQCHKNGNMCSEMQWTFFLLQIHHESCCSKLWRTFLFIIVLCVCKSVLGENRMLRNERKES